MANVANCVRGGLGMLILLFGCDGLISDPGATHGSTPSSTATCHAGQPSVATRPIRHLTPDEYANTLRDLFGDPGLVPSFDDETAVLTEHGAYELRDTAELVVSRRSSWTRTVIPCDTSGPADDSCAEALLDDFAPRAFRRPLTDGERGRLLATYQQAKADLSFADAIEMLVEIIVQAPQTVYLSEVGEAQPDLPAGIRALDAHELAARLSYFLWNTMPDDTLWDSATRDELRDPAVLRAQAERMLRDPRSERMFQRFISRWLQIDGGRLHNALEDTVKNADLFPTYDASLRAAMRTELEAFVRAILVEEGGTIEQLLLDRRAYVNGPLAELYGVEGGPSGADEWQWVALDPTERAGLLTRVSFLTVLSSANVSAPIRRGVHVYREILCEELGDPPPNVNNATPEGGTTDSGGVRSVRQDTDARTQGAQCQTCHGIINPIGYAFEHYDAIGRFRTDELGTGLPIDSSGAIQNTDVDRSIADAVDLSEALAESTQVRTCFARRMMTEAFGAAPEAADACSLDSVQQSFVDTGSVRDLVLALVGSDAFRYVAVEGGGT